MQFGPFTVENLQLDRTLISRSSTLQAFKDRLCDVRIPSLGVELPEMPYFGLLEALFVSLIALAGREDGSWLPLQLPEIETRLEMCVRGDQLAVRLIGSDEVFYSGALATTFVDVARSIREEALALETGDPALEIGVLVKFSAIHGW